MLCKMQLADGRRLPELHPSWSRRAFSGASRKVSTLRGGINLVARARSGNTAAGAYEQACRHQRQGGSQQQSGQAVPRRRGACSRLADAGEPFVGGSRIEVVRQGRILFPGPFRETRADANDRMERPWNSVVPSRVLRGREEGRWRNWARAPSAWRNSRAGRVDVVAADWCPRSLSSDQVALYGLRGVSAVARDGGGAGRPGRPVQVR